MNRSIINRFLAVSSAYLLADGILPATAQTMDAVAALPTMSVPAPATAGTASQRLASRYAGLAGSRENAVSLVGGLRTGGRVTLSGDIPAGSLDFTPPTRPMGWGNVDHALTLAQRQLAAQGIAQPTPEQLRAALTGGSVVNASGQTVTMPGILTQRSQGMGWGQIARSAGTTMGGATAPLHGGQGMPAAMPTRPAPVVTAAGYRHGTVTTATGEVVRAGHWSGEGAAHARAEARVAGALPPSAQLSRPAVVTPVASSYGIATAGNRGGFGLGSHGRGR